MGDIYLFTADGLFVATLFKDVRQGKSWAMPAAGAAAWSSTTSRCTTRTSGRR